MPSPALRPAPLDSTWTWERDTRFADFLAQRLTWAETTGCRVEKQLAAGVREVYENWTTTRNQARASGAVECIAQMDCLGWALRCIASRAWRTAPGWENAFHPDAADVEPTPEIPR